MRSDTKSVPDVVSQPSGRFVLRVDRDLHASLKEEASERGISLNELCVRRLSLPTRDLDGPERLALASAARTVGGSLLGAVAYGSWARGEMGDQSDVDVLIVVDDELSIDRNLYRKWDESPTSWQGHTIEPHFVRLIGGDASVSAVWGEAAIDGIVLFDRDLSVCRRLASIRKQIARGEIVRRTSHGQHYWIEVGP